MAETRQTWAHPAARQDNRRTVELWVSYMCPGTSLQLRAAEAKAGRLLRSQDKHLQDHQVHTIMPGYFLQGQDKTVGVETLQLGEGTGTN